MVDGPTIANRYSEVNAIATMFQASPLALMSLPESNITSLQDLVGQQVGVHVDGPQVMDLVKSVSDISAADLNVIEIHYENKYDLLLSGELAAMRILSNGLLITC